MAKMKSLEERYADEILTDNSKIPKYEQCKNCIFRGLEINGEWISDGNRAICRMYSPPKIKPMGIYHGTEVCEYYEKEKIKKK